MHSCCAELMETLVPPITACAHFPVRVKWHIPHTLLAFVPGALIFLGKGGICETLTERAAAAGGADGDCALLHRYSAGRGNQSLGVHVQRLCWCTERVKYFYGNKKFV
jgi:hypothetical protein